MGLQLHQFNRIRESKWRTQLNHASLQHQTQHQYPWCTRLTCQTQDLELTLQEKVLVLVKKDLFKAIFNSNYLENKSKYTQM